MSTQKRFTHDSTNEYFDGLPKGTQELVKELILEAASNRRGPEGWKQDDEAIEDLECRSRDGFSAYSHNKGGFVYRNFAKYIDYWGGGYGLSHEKANVELSRLIDSSLDAVQEQFLNDHEAEFKTLGLTPNDAGYSALYEAGHKVLAEKFSEAEFEALSDENSTVMHEFRFMYHGRENGLHSASVSAAVNLEAPYHRSSISWARDVFCEGGKEVEITWRNQAELKRKLAKALKQVSKAVF